MTKSKILNEIKINLKCQKNFKKRNVKFFVKLDFKWS